MNIKPTDLLRYLLWLGVLNTANANRKYFGLPTTWVVHLTLNSLFLFLPEIYRGVTQVFHLDERAGQKRDFIMTAHRTIQDTVVNNPQYAIDVAPVAFAYMVSHPHFNIYKGEWAKVRLLGFGLDAIPHATTAYTFTNLAIDGLAAFARNTPPDAKWHDLAEGADEHSRLLAGGFLLGASTLYEGGEYAIHAEEMRETGGDESKINLVWSVQDTVFDLMSNALGWAAAVMLRKAKRPRRRQIALK